MDWKFDNTYSRLSNSLFTKLKPLPVKNPKLVLFNYSLSKKLDLNFENSKDDDIANIFSGNKLPKGSETIAQAYAGHQFGHFTVLGDGRALILGEHITKKRERYDIQFKGSGRTPYSRNADGRAALGPMLREYIISEAMHFLGIKTSRSLAVVKTGESVIREKKLDGAILTRIASSHIRVGTFQFALISKNENDLKSLFEYTVNRHYPLIANSECVAIELLKKVQEKQIQLICDWMRVGFVHGVMNTDNMTVSGETIDYGPCAFMDHYDPSTVFSSIDINGRYAYFNQPRIARWNLERFAESLLPLINKNSEKAIELAENVLNKFSNDYKKSWLKMMKNKLGILGEEPSDENLIIELLSWMHKNKADYTNTFCLLMDQLKEKDKVYDNSDFYNWRKKWEARRKSNNVPIEDSTNLMRRTNPLIIPRNHLVEDAIQDATKNNDYSKTLKLIDILKSPYDPSKLNSTFQSKSNLNNEKYVTYCGT